MSFRETNIPYINSSNMTRKSVEEPKALHKGIFSKFTSLKKRQNSPLLNRNQQNNQINNYEEVKLNQYKETHESDNPSSNKDGIIQQEYEETTEARHAVRSGWLGTKEWRTACTPNLSEYDVQV